MSKDIIIQKSGVEQELDGVTKLRTGAVDGGTCDWVPEDEVQVGPLLVTENGLYHVSDVEGLYGWNRVITLVETNYVVTTDPDDGKEYIISTDEDGVIVKEELPVSIGFEQLPSKTVYSNGETINLSGAIIHAYYEDGSDWGSIGNVVSVSPTAASGEGGGVVSSERMMSAPLATLTPVAGEYNPAGIHENMTRQSYFGWEFAYPSTYNTYDNQWNYNVLAYKNGSLVNEWYGTPTPLTFHYVSEYPFTLYKLVMKRGDNNDGLYYTMEEYGQSPPPGMFDVTTQAITVMWPREGDGKLLTTTFDITVV